MVCLFKYIWTAIITGTKSYIPASKTLIHAGFKSFKSIHHHRMVFFITTVTIKFEAISAHLMIAFLTCANAIRKFYTLMMTMTIDIHLRALITGEQYNTSFQYSFAFVRVSKIT